MPASLVIDLPVTRWFLVVLFVADEQVFDQWIGIHLGYVALTAEVPAHTRSIVLAHAGVGRAAKKAHALNIIMGVLMGGIDKNVIGN